MLEYNRVTYDTRTFLTQWRVAVLETKNIAYLNEEDLPDISELSFPPFLYITRKHYNTTKQSNYSNHYQKCSHLPFPPPPPPRRTLLTRRTTTSFQVYSGFLSVSSLRFHI